MTSITSHPLLADYHTKMYHTNVNVPLSPFLAYAWVKHILLTRPFFPSLSLRPSKWCLQFSWTRLQGKAQVVRQSKFQIQSIEGKQVAPTNNNSDLLGASRHSFATCLKHLQSSLLVQISMSMS